ncbi:MAG: type I secretion system permease/ATPase [Rhodobacteraceae bacterium]|nr:type I secretion system permease/ATPase [Paracoccaceae bacterium]
MSDQNSLQLAFKKYRTAFAATMVFSFFSNLLMFVGPIYMLQIYDRVLSSRNETTLIALSVIAVALLLSYGLLEYTRTRLLVRAGLQFDEVLANPVFHRVVKQSIMAPGSGAHVALSDIDKMREFMTGQGILSFFDAPWVPLFLALCFSFHPWLGAVATVGAVIIFGLALANEFSTRGALAEAGKAGQGASLFASATMQNAEVIRAMGMEKPLSDRWLTQHDEMLDQQARASGRGGAVVASSKFVRMSLQVAILGVGAYLAMLQQISPGIMIAASIVMGRALAPVEQAVQQWKGFVAARQSHKRVKQLFAAIPEDQERMQLPDPKGDIAVEALYAMAPGTRESILKNISFSVKAGEILAVIGPSGSGKSTLIRHLVGASVPASGAVRLDGTEMQHWDTEQVGRYVGYLPQDVKLFRGSVKENISRFQEGAADDDIVAASKLSGAHDMIQTLGQGYDSNVGEGGNSLSGGQKQRVGLARAVYREPSLIVLDEPNSNLDNHGEQALMNCIKELKAKGKTVVLVTHKTNLLAMSDKTLMLVDGTVEKFGNTKEMFQPKAQPNPADKPAAAAAGAPVVQMQKKPAPAPSGA